MAKRESSIAANAGKVDRQSTARLPRIVLIHYSAPPVVGGVEAVLAEQVRQFRKAGFPTLVIAGRGAAGETADLGEITLIPEIDSENTGYLDMVDALRSGTPPQAFRDLQAAIGQKLAGLLKPDDILIAHNVMTTHFNLALTAAVHSMVTEGRLPRLIIWCHDISRHVNPAREEAQYHGWPWDALRTRLAGATYVAVSTARQQALAAILGCSPGDIQVVPNGVDPATLLGLSPLVEQLAEAYDLYSADIIVLMPIRVTRAKNIEFALEVVRMLKAARLVVRLIVTGPPDPHVADIPDYLADLLARRAELDLHDEVRFVYEGIPGHPAPFVVDDQLVAALFRLSDIILMPSKREGFGMPVFEAALVDRPVFATGIPATHELPGFRYLIGNDEPADSVARRIADWAENDAAHPQRVTVRRHYTWSGIFARQLLPMIEALQENPEPRS